jgi:hypothetical protein
MPLTGSPGVAPAPLRCSPIRRLVPPRARQLRPLTLDPVAWEQPDRRPGCATNLSIRARRPSLISILNNNQREERYQQEQGQPYGTGEEGPAENQRQPKPSSTNPVRNDCHISSLRSYTDETRSYTSIRGGPVFTKPRKGVTKPVVTPPSEVHRVSQGVTILRPSVSY